MDPETHREIAGKGGRAAHARGTAHEWSPAEARQAGRKGGLARARNDARARRLVNLSDVRPRTKAQRI
jgi:general stress protein YciG